jgi:N-methylhydantoinase A/oxoprolinase/acetone carboxylase beta subunit
MTNSIPLFLGIDTGGTYTDGILLEPVSRKILKSTKALTTHHDLKQCIGEVFDQLLNPDPGPIALVSLSTTLATNAIAEGKRRPVALFLLGYDPELVERFGFAEQFGTQYFSFIPGRHDLEGVEQVPLDEIELTRNIELVGKYVDALAVASFAGPMNSGHEQRAAEVLRQSTDLPVVQAHHLSSELDSIRRATTASLNAALLSNLHDFLEAVQSMAAHHGLKCPIMLVRGDGSIVKAEFARQRPVEMVHSGPATSALGGQFLAGVERALVVDMGGTTTDLTLIDGGRIQAMEQSATVGEYRTCVRTIRARSFGLGGDSLIKFDHWQKLSLGPERVLPISRMCTLYPSVKQDLLARLQPRRGILYSDRFEYWALRNEPTRPVSDPRTRQAINILRDGPQFLQDLLKQVGVYSPVQIDMDDLINQGIIDRAGLTPTDLLHVSGEYAPWDPDSAWVMTRAAAHIWSESPEEFVRRIKRLITDRLVAEIVQYLSGKALTEANVYSQHRNLDRWLYEESLAPVDPYLGCCISLKIPLVGIGAPAHVFLPPVAEALGTEMIIPDHYEVANAAGTVVGNIVVRHEGEVIPCVEGSAITGYFARVANSQKKFGRGGEALQSVRETLEQSVRAEAAAAGAESVVFEMDEQELIPGIYRLSAWAIGKPGLNGDR